MSSHNSTYQCFTQHHNTHISNSHFTGCSNWACYLTHLLDQLHPIINNSHNTKHFKIQLQMKCKIEVVGLFSNLSCTSAVTAVVQDKFENNPTKFNNSYDKHIIENTNCFYHFIQWHPSQTTGQLATMITEAKHTRWSLLRKQVWW